MTDSAVSPAPTPRRTAGQESGNPSTPTVTPTKHSVIEDLLGILTGTFLVSLGLFLLRTSETVTGGTAGLALLLSYAIHLPFGVIFLAVNVPFFALAVSKKGWDFTIRTALSVSLVSVMASLHPAEITHIHVDPVYATLVGNLLAGMGLLILIRHRSSLGGFNILVLIVQERFGLRAGYVQMILDVTVVVASLAIVSPLKVALSAAGAVLLNIVLAFNHRPGRYTGT
ncbi:YitT family protein [Streptomyces luteolifulvus]|uniref:YitT family protein n=1 Tax=Streptomyces luteolifulvus TaxID=2615112 RepID=A0A6H9UPZ0_9ACTN|nr:YitT family protein [Streptomyces luteolifulvus]KAB1139976.1 YitT family protein [Streptomyces luteolifulvus]